MIFHIFVVITKFLVLIVPVLLVVALFTLLERKIIGYIQRRRGPNLVGPFGILQPFSDALKLLIKEPLIPANANLYLYLSAPLITIFLSMLNWVVIPFSKEVVLVDLNFGVLYLLSLSSLGVYGIIIAG